ncbi:adenosylcobinamide-GDP ribazoletransferase [Sedimentitalea sp. CY04]|uniref:Adenosylcobinamide-GDP ribazoletransferase n=1 Tax=Parasedimentitalea denitrificans TaxID=2211118 RepID=A0ABX0W2J2_9RHOB|nr:adenosylcobinamide-GDP ribazoletransferase [Sedimentitalea sp. CY04]NIZ59858.1 adenosylcobinamide-GDP ribazoletransferase [Sedimentitalea sp. CY04]
MRKYDIIRDISLSLVLLTRLPLPALPKPWFQHQAQAVWAFPVAGLAVTLPACTVAMLALWVGLPASIAAGLLITVQIVLTGAMHEDGLADTADGFWGGFSPERRLEIMKDSQIGTYGVLALLLSIGLRWLALTTVLSTVGIWTPLALALLSRAAMPILMVTLSNARTSGLSQSVGRPSSAPAFLGLFIALLISVPIIGLAITPVLIAMGLATLAIAMIARAKIGGQTGDVLGAGQNITELVGLLVMLAI